MKIKPFIKSLDNKSKSVAKYLNKNSLNYGFLSPLRILLIVQGLKKVPTKYRCPFFECVRFDGFAKSKYINK